jgi:protein ImuB
VPEFAAQAMVRLRPELAGRAVAVVQGAAPLEQVCSLNAWAVRCGVLAGMTRAELESFAEVCVLRRSEAEERVARGVLLELAGRFTPRAEVWPAAALVMVLDVAGTERIFGAPEQMVERVRAALREVRFYAQMAVSANFHAAVCLAGVARKVPRIVTEGKEAEALAGLPLAALGLTAAQAETLALWGLQRVGELAALPEVELVVRLGQAGKRLRRLARGEHPHLMVPLEEAWALEEYMGFDAPVELMESLLFVLGPMLEQILLRAQGRALALASVTVTLGLDGGGEHQRRIQPALPVAEREVLLKLLHLDLQAHPPGAGVMWMRVQAEPGARSKVQMGLFAPQLPEAMRLDVTLARVAALVGEGRVGRARLLDNHRPESFVMERFVVKDANARESEQGHDLVAMRRCRPPVSLMVQQEGRRLRGFFLRGKRYSVQEAFGPWRRSGSWWSAEVWSQEEWDVRAEAEAGEVLLGVVSHDRLRQVWRLEAVYD